jgi:hypothetical protein
MPSFEAGKDPLTYDFTKYVPDAKGEIPEPSSLQVETFFETLRQLMPVTMVDGKAKIDLAELAKMVEAGDDVNAMLVAAISDVCSNSPTVEQITALPHRDKSRFIGWITGTFFLPEA